MTVRDRPSAYQSSVSVGEAEPSAKQPVVSASIGVGFVLLGTAMIGVAGWQHVRFCRRLTLDQKPEMYSIWLSQVVAFVVSLLSGALAVYLLVSTRW